MKLCGDPLAEESVLRERPPFDAFAQQVRVQ